MTHKPNANELHKPRGSHTESASIIRTRAALAVVAGIGLGGCMLDGGALQSATKDQPLYVDDTRLWTGPDIKVCWAGSGFATEKQWVKDLITGPESWSAAADIRFVGWQPCVPGETAIHITPGTAMSSAIGAQGATQMELDFSSAPQNTWTRCISNNLGRQRCIEVMSLHEFGHALGFAHEHNRADTPSSCTAAPQGGNGTVTYGDWDPSSIMSYCSTATRLSMTDIMGVQAFYGTNAVSLQSYNYPDRYIRHANSLIYLDPLTTTQIRLDGQFEMVPGLADNSCVSFRSINFPGLYLRHQGFRFWVHNKSSDTLFQQDATFCIRPGNADPSWVSFESINFPGHYIRHQGFELYLHSGSGALFNEDTTFRMVNPYGTFEYDASNTASATVNTVNHRIDVQAGETISVGTCDLVGSAGNGDTYLRLYDNLGAEVASNDDSCGGRLSKLSFTATSSGTYEIAAGCYSSNTCDGVTIYTRETLGSFAFNASATSSATVNTVNRQVDLSGGQTITLGTCGVNGATTSTDTYLRLYDQNGNQVAFNDDRNNIQNSCGQYASHLSYTVPEGASGTYEIRAGCYGSASCSGTVGYRF